MLIKKHFSDRELGWEDRELGIGNIAMIDPFSGF